MTFNLTVTFILFYTTTFKRASASSCSLPQVVPTISQQSYSYCNYSGVDSAADSEAERDDYDR